MTNDELGRDRQTLERDVLDQLLALRSAKGVLTPAKLARFPRLVEVSGAGDLLDAFMAFRRELRRYMDTANRNEAAAALSILAADEHVGQRLQYVAHRLSDGEPMEQRTARRWSDLGMPRVAADLVYMAQVKQRLGRELLEIGVEFTPAGSMLVRVDQMVLAILPDEVPEFSLWATGAEGNPEQIAIDLAQHAPTTVLRDNYRMTRHRLLVAHEILDRITEDQGVTVVVTGRDAPMRTVTFSVPTQVPPDLAVSYSAYRDRATAEVSRRTATTAPDDY